KIEVRLDARAGDSDRAGGLAPRRELVRPHADLDRMPGVLVPSVQADLRDLGAVRQVDRSIKSVAVRRIEVPVAPDRAGPVPAPELRRRDGEYLVPRTIRLRRQSGRQETGDEGGDQLEREGRRFHGAFDLPLPSVRPVEAEGRGEKDRHLPPCDGISD